MNMLAHLAASYAIGAHLTDDPRLMLLAVLFGILPDFDHIPHLKRAVGSGRFGPQSRSRFHELYGLAITTTLAAAAYAINPLLSVVILLPFLAHYLMDFLTRPTRPFHPIDDTLVDLKIYPRSLLGLTIADTIVTAVMILWLIL